LSSSDLTKTYTGKEKRDESNMSSEKGSHQTKAIISPFTTSTAVATTKDPSTKNFTANR
jgi:hypothetical protein